jgi:hypothetical protein
MEKKEMNRERTKEKRKKGEGKGTKDGRANKEPSRDAAELRCAC